MNKVTVLRLKRLAGSFEGTVFSAFSIQPTDMAAFRFIFNRCLSMNCACRLQCHHWRLVVESGNSQAAGTDSVHVSHLLLVGHEGVHLEDSKPSATEPHRDLPPGLG